MEAEGVQITLDKLDHSRDQTRDLQATGGYAITHVGEAIKTDGSTFTVQETDSLRQDLFWFCRFAGVVGHDQSSPRAIPRLAKSGGPSSPPPRFLRGVVR